MEEILPEVGKSHVAVFEPTASITGGGEERLTFTFEFQSTRDNVLGHFRLSISTDLNPAAELAETEIKLAALLPVLSG